MARDPRGEEKEWEANDPVVGANTTSQEEPIATEPGTPVGGDLEKESSSELDEKRNNQDTIIPVVSRRSVATSIYPESSAIDAEPVKRSWISRLNPLKRNPPEVPKERKVSREYTAGRLSRLTFQWITPLMTVCLNLLNIITKR
jgi:ATP-binding cassette, subfamily C (CFTR/MRP), member 1